MFVAGPNWLKMSFLIFHGWWPSGKLPAVAATPRQGVGHGPWHPFPHPQRVSTLHSHKGTTVRVLHLGNHTVRVQEWENTVNNPQRERSLKWTTEYSLGNNCRFPLLPLFSVSTDKRMQENWGCGHIVFGFLPASNPLSVASLLWLLRSVSTPQIHRPSSQILSSSLRAYLKPPFDQLSMTKMASDQIIHTRSNAW